MSYERISAPSVIDFPDEWYNYSGADHFWLKWRMKVFQKLLSDRSFPIREPLHVLEVGCGHAILRAEMESCTRWTVDGADINEAALQKANPARGKTLLYNILERRAEFHEAYDAVVLFDVLEHIQEPDSFLEAACWHLKPGGWVFINVPALMGLYSRYDKAVGHFRRYNFASIRHLLASQTPELEVIETRYWGFFLIPLAGLRKILLQKIRPEKIVKMGFKPPSRWINSLLQGFMLLEISCLNRSPLGTSVMALARKSGARLT